jgi:hypothetical protein
MSDATTGHPSVSRCQARPRAARPGYREDMLCASAACTVVVFHGGNVPVCRIHEAKYDRWGERAEQHAAAEWGWAPSPGPAPVGPGAQAALLVSVRA